jgi:hypothetical protein
VGRGVPSPHRGPEAGGVHPRPSFLGTLGARGAAQAEARLAGTEAPRLAGGDVMPPQRIETSLLVVAPFKDASGVEWREGDRVPVHRRSVRLAALEHPELFVMEYATEPVDMAWLRRLDAERDAEFEQLKAAKGSAEARRQQALRKELEEQERGPSLSQKDLERRFKKQEAERAEHEKKIREAREREKLEAEFALDSSLTSGFHY